MRLEDCALQARWVICRNVKVLYSSALQECGISSGSVSVVSACIMIGGITSTKAMLLAVLDGLSMSI